jgi:hypothetical protein
VLISKSISFVAAAISLYVSIMSDKDREIIAMSSAKLNQSARDQSISLV